MADSTWLTPTVVRQTAGLREGDVTDTAALTHAANAAAAFVEEIHPEIVVPPPVPETEPPTGTTYVVPATYLLGAAMLANRWYQRRSSPLGIVGFAELGGAGILRHDPDIARLLKIGEHARFVFGAPALPVVEEPAP